MALARWMWNESQAAFERGEDQVAFDRLMEKFNANAGRESDWLVATQPSNCMTPMRVDVLSDIKPSVSALSVTISNVSITFPELSILAQQEHMFRPFM